MSDERRGRMLVLVAALAGVVLVGSYLAAGGAAYEPAAVADPCEPREWREPSNVEELAEQFSLSALDGAACELRVSREELARGISTKSSREAFVRRYGIEDAAFEAAVRAGLVRAVDDAERAGALPSFIAGALRELAERVPVEEGVGLLEDSSALFGAAGGLFGGLIGDAEDLIPEDVRELVP